MPVEKEQKPKSDLAKSFCAFRKNCIWLQNCYNIFNHLYEDNDVKPILQQTAHIFFDDLNCILVEYLFLLIGRLTDPAGRGKKETLSILSIDRALMKKNLYSEDIRNLSVQLMKYSKLLKPARNNLIAHSNKAITLEGSVLGAHSKTKMIQFFQNLQKYCDQVGHAVGEGALDFQTQAGEGDVLDLIKALEGHSSNA